MPTYSQTFAYDASRLQDKVRQLLRAQGRVAALMKKENLPDGTGYNLIAVGTNRSNPVGGSGWVDVSSPDNTGNNCMPDPSVVTPSLTTISYNIQQQIIKSYPICLTDARRGYEWEEQVKNTRENFALAIKDVWEDKSKERFQYWSGNKIIFNSSLTRGSGTTFPNVEATYIPSQDLLDQLWQEIIQAGGGEEPYAMSNGAACIPAIMSIEANRALIKGSDAVRQDFRFAQMGKGYEGAQLLQSWGVDKPYGGFMHVIDPRMPRYNFVNGAYVEVPYYSTESASIGADQAVVNPDYKTANFEVMYLWHPEVVIRKTPRPMGSVGADTKFRATNYNGDIGWFNIPNETTNLFSNQGVYAANLMAAFAPTVKRIYGYSIMFRRCPTVIGSECSY